MNALQYMGVGDIGELMIEYSAVLEMADKNRHVIVGVGGRVASRPRPEQNDVGYPSREGLVYVAPKSAQPPGCAAGHQLIQFLFFQRYNHEADYTELDRAFKNSVKWRVGRGSKVFTHIRLRGHLPPVIAPVGIAPRTLRVRRNEMLRTVP